MAVLLFAALLLLAAQVSTAQEQPAGDLLEEAQQGQVVAAAAPVPGGPGFISLSGVDFKPLGSSSGYALFYSQLYNSGPSQIGTYLAPVDLPHGATVTKFVVYFLDNEANKDLTARLYRAGLSAGEITPLATVMSARAGADPQVLATTVITAPLVDRQSNAYYVLADLPRSSFVRLFGVRIDYAYSTYLPSEVKP